MVLLENNLKGGNLMKKLMLAILILGPFTAQATSPGQMVKAQLWYEGIERQPKISLSDENMTNDKPTKTVSSSDFVEELSRPMHLVLKKHRIILNQ